MFEEQERPLKDARVPKRVPNMRECPTCKSAQHARVPKRVPKIFECPRYLSAQDVLVLVTRCPSSIAAPLLQRSLHATLCAVHHVSCTSKGALEEPALRIGEDWAARRVCVNQ